MYEYVDWMKCKHCGNTNCLFYIRTDFYHKKITGNIRYKTTSKCKICYLEDSKIKNDNWYSNKKNRDKANFKARKNRKNNPTYLKRAREYYQKRRYKALEQKRLKYIHRKDNRPEIIKNAIRKQCLQMSVYTKEML